MIRASEARKNVEIYELEIYTSVNKQVTELIEIMDEIFIIRRVNIILI